MSKTVLFTPGLGEGLATHRPYQDTLQVFEDLGYNSHFVPIDWRENDHATSYDVAAQLREVYDAYKPDVLAGFSFGAIASLCVAAERRPAAVWACSLSAFFKEDLTPEVIAQLKGDCSPEQIGSYKSLSFAALAGRIACPVELFVGSEECKRWERIAKRATTAEKLLPAARLTIVLGADHDITAPSYLTALRDTLPPALD